MSPKAFYATSYLACIPLFACVYNFVLPDSFYHSTVQFEYPTMNREASGILDGIRISIVKRLGTQPQAAACGNWRIELGVLYSDRNASKAIVTTTASFAPGIELDPGLAPFVPHRLQLRSGKSFRDSLRRLYPSDKLVI
jgi:hypothetical protein